MTFMTSTNEVHTFGELVAYPDFIRAVCETERFDGTFGYVVYERPNNSVVLAVYRLSDNDKVVVNLVWSKRSFEKVGADFPYVVGDDISEAFEAIVDGSAGPMEDFIIDTYGVAAGMDDKVVTVVMNGDRLA